MKQDASKENFGLAEPYENFSQLLKTVRKNAGVTAQQIAKYTGVHTNSQSYYENKQRDPNIDYLVSFSCALDIPFWQLVSRRVELGAASAEDKNKVLNEVGPMIKHVTERYQGYRVGEGDPDYQQANKADSPTYKLMKACYELVERYQDNENIQVLNHDGNSMSPTINQGDAMVVDTSSTVLTEGDVFVFKNGSVYSAKRVQLLPGGGVLLVPDNPQYRSVKLDSEDVAALDVQGKMVCSISYY